MKVVQSYWSQNWNGDLKSYLTSEENWLSVEFKWISWALSCFHFKRFFSLVHLTTDDLGKRILIDYLKLPYTSYDTSLEVKLKNYPSSLWILAKIHTYGVQDQPFLHADGDVFIWKVPDSIKKARIFVQHIEKKPSPYDLFFDTIINLKKSIPLYFYNSTINDQYACNLGVVGGTDLDFFREYSNELFDFINTNLSEIIKLHEKDAFIANFIEQHFFYMKLKNNNVIATTWLADKEVTHEDVFKRFEDVPVFSNYIHLMGMAKIDAGACRNLSLALRKIAPAHYYRILRFCQHAEQVLYNTAYYVDELNPILCSTKTFLGYKNKFKQKDFDYFTQFKKHITFKYTSLLVELKENLASIKQDVTEPNLMMTLLKDGINYYSQMNNYVENLPSEVFLYSKEWNEYDCFCKLTNKSVLFLQTQYVVLNDHVLIIDVQYDWTRRKKLKTYLLDDTNQLQILLMPNLNKMTLHEILLDSLSMILLESCQTKLTIRSILDRLYVHFSEDYLQKNFLQINNFLIKKLLTYLNTGVLKWIK